MADLLFNFYAARPRRPRIYRLKTSQIDEFTDRELRMRYRFGRQSIIFITNLIYDDLKRKTKRNHALCPIDQVLIALRFYASGSFLQVIGDTVGVDKATVSRVVFSVTQALIARRDQFIKWPSNQEIQEIKNAFFQRGGFPGVIGCVDGTHIRIQAPHEYEKAYVNRKNYHSINVQGICNHEGMFTNVVARWPGSTHDSHIFRNSKIHDHLLRTHRSLEDGILLANSSWKEGKVSQDDLMNSKWTRLGEGGFSNVFKATLKGNVVAIKVLKDFEESKALFTEGNLLRNFRHDNIVAFRAMDILEKDISELNLTAGSPFLVMEHIPNNLYKYVESQRTPETRGLPLGQVWNFVRQMANGLYYLHSLAPPVSHSNLKPDNILLNIRSMQVKLAGFGLSRQIHTSSEGMISMFQARWTAPEIWEVFEDDPEYYNTDGEAQESTCTFEEEIEDDVIFYLRADIYSYGQVAAYILTGDMPWPGRNSPSVADIREGDDAVKEDKVVLPDELTGPLKDIIKMCRDEDPFHRPTIQQLVNVFFASDENPYQSEAESAEFFSCGFLKDTKIFVADSLVDVSSEGYNKTKETPQGYPAECLLSEVEVGNKDYNTSPQEWIYEQKYNEYYAHFKQKAIEKKIEDNPAIALKHLVTPREDVEERQEILLRYGQSTYCHHRAMREIWMKVLDETKRRKIVPCKSVINPVFSTSFGLHVAVITADSPPKFIFARRANRDGMATPGKFTCVAVESASVKDYESKDGKTFVNLIQTAARGLEEELRVELHGDDVKALCLSTVYLQFDTHEWGLCGFVDLSDERIDPKRRLTFEQLGSRFSAGPKNKFEHEEVIAVDFTLPTMVDFVSENYLDFASSAKLVVVKVLQSFFGVAAVEQAFKSME